MTPVARESMLERHPEIRATLEILSSQLKTMAALNAAVDLQARKVEDVA